MNCKILCLGDSNTFGYDPRSLFGAQFEAENRWVDIVQTRTGWECINAGQNGREIPRRSFEMETVRQLICRYQPDLILVMLGTNDLLQGADAEAVTAGMEAFLRQLPGSVFLVAPPPLRRGAWVESDALVAASHLLGQSYRVLAEHLEIPFADSGDWEIDLLFDGVHFSEAGHHVFAEQLIKVLEGKERHDGSLCGH